MKNTLISIIVPVYKVEQYIHTCVDSVLNQTYTHWELILVDDGSPDNCPAICDAYAVKDKRIRVIHKRNGGVASARNMALDNFQGDYVAFLDSDDFWHTSYLEALLNLSQKHDADIAQCNFIKSNDKVFPILKDSNKIGIFDGHSVFLRGYAKIVLWAKLYKAYLFEEIRMPEGKFFEDDFTTWKWYYKAKKIVVSNVVLYYYTQNAESTMAGHANKPSLDFIEAYHERIEFFSKGGVKDMEDYSRAHLCKSLVLISGNPLLSAGQKEIVDTLFQTNLKLIQSSAFVPLYLRVLYFVFSYAPKPTLFFLKLMGK